ncbi:MAG: hypothetical protein GY950_14765 [bacterium]|nr:hypothetical protein [bacterium]
MNNIKYLILIIFLLSGLLPAGYAAPDQAGAEDKIILTWQDLQKLAGLKSDVIKLTWKEFQKLLEQSGNQIDMNFEIEGGIVTIKRDRFSKILLKMKPPSLKVPAPPKDYLVTEAKYTGTAGKNNCRFTVRFKVYVFPKETVSYTSIPVLSANTAVTAISVDGVPGVMHIAGGWYSVNLNKSGYHEVKAVFSMGKNKQSLSLPIIRSIINTVDFKVPFNDFEIKIDSSLNARLNPRTGSASPRSLVTANLPPMNRLTVKWNRKGKKKVRKKTLFYAETHCLISVGPDILKVDTKIDLEVLQSSLDTISIRVPRKDEVVKVSGRSIKNWQVRETGIGRVLEIHFGFDITDRYQFTVFTQRMLEADTLGLDFEGLQVVDARRETGAVGIVSGSAVEVEVQPGPELEKLEFHQLPQKILAMSSRPVLYSYKYARHPYRLGIAIHKYEQLEGISTVIESADGTALFLREGKLLYKIVYTLRNSYKQFMELELPENAVIWTVIVDNKREKASRNKEGKVLIPLVRSSGNGDQLKSFKVQLIYTQPFDAFGLRGGSEYSFPKTDIFMNKIRMAMFLPEGYSYGFDKGEWKEDVVSPPPASPVSRARGKMRKPGLAAPPVPPVPGKKMVAGERKELDEFESKLPTGRDIPASQVFADRSKKEKGKADLLTGPAGLSSVNVYLPISGVKYVYSKKIINKRETYPLKFSYFHKQTQRVIYLFLGIFLLLVLSFYLKKRLKSK